MKTLTLILSAAVVLTAAADDSVPTDRAKWSGNPIAWRFDPKAGTIRSTRGFGVVMLETDRAARAVFSAKLKPELALTNGWTTLGLALAEDVDNYWGLNLAQSPDGRRYCELCEMRQGEWLSQNLDRLAPQGKLVDCGAWTPGTVYSLRLELNPDGIRGEIRDAAGKVLFARGFAFGDRPAVRTGRPALKVMGGFVGVISDLTATMSERLPNAPRTQRQAKSFPPYDGTSFVPGVTAPAEGFFRVKRLDDGRWWVIDPLGRGIFLTGVDHVRYEGHCSIRTNPITRNYRDWNNAHYPSVDAWCAETLDRLRKWGFNMLGGGATAQLHHRGMIYSLALSMGDGLCWDGMDPDYFICPNEHRPCSAFPNVFHPDFAAWCDYLASRRCAPNRNDPWLFGYFIDNELAWWGRGARKTGLFDAAMRLPAGHTARQTAVKFLRDRGLSPERPVPDDVKHDFLRLAAEKYFQITSEAIRRHDPNHLVLGARFAGLEGADPVVWEVSGKWCDVATFNCYPWCDLDRNVALTTRNSGERVADAFARYYGYLQKPVLVTEWSFPALDSGLPCTAGAGQRFRTQDGRTAATELFAKTMLALPFIVGYDYFMWVDQPPEGMSDAFPEDSNYGLVSEKGVPYPGITSMFERLHRDIGKWRRAGLPVERPLLPDANRSRAADFARERGGWSADGFVRTGDVWRWTNAAGLALEGGFGWGKAIRKVTLNGRELGEAGPMAHVISGCGNLWADANKVVKAEFRDGRLWLTAQGFYDKVAFEILTSVALAKDRPEFLLEAVSCANIGKEPLELRHLFLRQYSPFMRESASSRNVPNLWQEPTRAAWLANDGRWFGAFSLSPDVTTFNYFLSNGGKHVHPDAAFANLELPRRLAPGERHDAKGGVYMLCRGGFGGKAEFESALRP